MDTRMIKGIALMRAASDFLAALDKGILSVDLKDSAFVASLRKDTEAFRAALYTPDIGIVGAGEVLNEGALS